MRRFGRIFPLHFVTLMVSAIIVILISQGITIADDSLFVTAHQGLTRPVLIRGIVANLTLVHAWGTTPGLLFNLPSWSISAEWFAYMAFPAFIIFLQGLARRETTKLAIVLFGFLTFASVTYLTVGAELTRMSWNIGIFRIVPEFLIGLSLHRFGRTWTAGPSGSIIGFVNSIAVIAFGVYLSSVFPQAIAVFAAITVLALGALVLFGADASRYGHFRWLGGDIGVYLGEISYSIYMLHFLIAEVFFSFLAPWWRPIEFLSALLTVLGVTAFVIACSSISYRVLEVPSRSWIVSKSRILNEPRKNLDIC